MISQCFTYTHFLQVSFQVIQTTLLQMDAASSPLIEATARRILLLKQASREHAWVKQNKENEIDVLVRDLKTRVESQAEACLKR